MSTATITLEMLIEEAAALTQQVGLQEGGIAPTLFYTGRDKDGVETIGIFMLPTLPKSSYARRAAVHVLRSVLKRNRATSYVLATEAWTRTVTKQQAPVEEWDRISAQMRRDGLAADPLRQECAVYIGGDQDKGISQSWLIQRERPGDDTSTLIGFKPHSEPHRFDRNSEVDSWMVGLLW